MYTGIQLRRYKYGQTSKTSPLVIVQYGYRTAGKQ